MDMNIILGGVLLPNFGTLGRQLKPGESDHVTLGGHLYTDFLNIKRVWTLSWEILKFTDYQTLLNLYYRQHRDKVYLDLQIDAYSIYCKARIDISERDLKHNGVVVKAFTVTLTEIEKIDL